MAVPRYSDLAVHRYGDVPLLAQEKGQPLNHGHYALFYQNEYGLSVIPGLAGSKEPYKTGFGHSLHIKASNGGRISEDEIVRFWGWEPFANVLMFPGSISGVDVIDVDCKPGQRSGFDTLAEHGLSWVIDETQRVLTPTGNGLHLYFKHTDDWGRNKKPPGSGLEVFWAGNQYVVMPPSIWDSPIPGEHGQYSCNESFIDLDELKPIPEELVKFFLGSSKNSPNQNFGLRPPGHLFGNERSNPPAMPLFVQVSTKTLHRLGSESKRQWREDNSFKHLAKNTQFPAKVKYFKSQASSIQAWNQSRHIIQQALEKLEYEAHRTLTNLFKYRQWFCLLNDDGTEDGWIFKLRGKWHWVGMPGTKHYGFEVKPTHQELGSIQGKGNGKYIVRDDGSIIVQFKHNSESGKTSKVGWYTVYDELQILELDEFV